jgi:hypothetical protein
MPARAGDRDDAVLKQSAETLEDGTWDFGKLVKRKQAAVRECSGMSLELGASPECPVRPEGF